MKNNLLKITVLAFIFLAYSFTRPGTDMQQPGFEPAFPLDPEFLSSDSAWVDSVMDKMSLDERIAQMIMIDAYSNKGESYAREVERIISRYKVGGVMFFQGNPVSQLKLTNRFQEEARTPLLIAIDGETGLGMRLKNSITYPPQMALGAISDNRTLYEMGRDIAQQMRRLGIHMNFAPVADVNNNPANPVINTRSFGEDPKNVASKVIAVMQGMQDHGLLLAAKHFPGHGDTNMDSHRGLPLILHDRNRLDTMELYPFSQAILRGLSGIMVAHLQVPAIDSRANRPTSLSRPAITELLIQELEFKGLIITDALNMSGLSEFSEPGMREVEAVKAGNDILLMPGDVGKSIVAIKRAVRRGEISEEKVNHSCRKILLAKYWSGLNSYEPASGESILEDINRPDYQVHYRKLLEQSMTLARNRDSLLPLKHLEDIKLATVTIGKNSEEQSGSLADLYLEGAHFYLPSNADHDRRKELLSELTSFNTIIVHLLNTSSFSSRKYGITEETVSFIEQLDGNARLILHVGGFPYVMSRFENTDHLDAILFSFDDDPLNIRLAVQGIFGGIGLSGKLPVSAGTLARSGTGYHTGSPLRLGFSEPRDAGLNPDTLLLMESIIRDAIRQKAIPGCQLLVARRGKVVWHKAYGYHTYQRRNKVHTDEIYDLASITKITSTLPSLMRLRDMGLYHEDSLLGSYGIVPDSSNKAGLLISDILTHQAGLIPWIPFYYSTLEPLDTSQALISANWSHIYPLKIGPSVYANRNVKFVDSAYNKNFSQQYPIKVAENLFMNTNWRDTLYDKIYNSDLLSKEYRYSDLGYYMLQQLIEEESDTLLYPYVWYNFYAPLGAKTLGFLPLNRFSKERIIPTENDIFFRRQLLHGNVHDMGAAMLGGIAGHAGLFSNAIDLAKIMQMYLNGGWYGERRFIEASTLSTYTSCFNCDMDNRRGLGFDRPITEEKDAGPACDDASAQSFGHTGFTGTMVWVDPAYDLLYVFLSNRVHPNQGNTLLIDNNFRTRIQQVIYDALED